MTWTILNNIYTCKCFVSPSTKSILSRWWRGRKSIFVKRHLSRHLSNERGFSSSLFSSYFESTGKRTQPYYDSLIVYVKVHLVYFIRMGFFELKLDILKFFRFWSSKFTNKFLIVCTVLGFNKENIDIYYIQAKIELRQILSIFLNFWKSELQHSYKPVS